MTTTLTETIQLALHGRTALMRGLCAIVDANDLATLSAIPWHCMAFRDGRIYAIRNYAGQRILMHRFLLSPSDGEFVDHINGNGLDNRRSNLRICTPSQNSAHRVNISDEKKRSMGVTWSKQRMKWQAAIQYNGKRYCLGFFSDHAEALDARIAAEKRMFGDFAPVRIA